jgi:hypothetical protein
MLLIRPKPLVGESMVGYLHRLAEENGYSKVQHVSHLIKADRRGMERNLLDKNSVKLLSEQTGYNENELTNMTGYDLQDQIHMHEYNQLILRQRVQYCPLCFEKPIHQKSWCLSAINICPIHHTWLQDKCVCGKDINLQSLVKGNCLYCNTSLQMNLNLEELNSQLVSLQNEIYRLFIGAAQKIIILDTPVGVKQFLSLVRHSLSLLHDTPSFLNERVKIRDLTSRGKHHRKSCLSYFEVIELYREFPNRFIQVLGEQKSKIPSAQTTAKYNFEKLFIDPIWEPIRQIYSDYLNNTKSSKATWIIPSVLNISSYSYLSKTAASHFLGIGIESVKKLICLGILHEVTIGFEKKIALDEIRHLFDKCKGEQHDCMGRISLRDFVQLYPKKGLDIPLVIWLVLEGILLTASTVTCRSLMEITFNQSEIDFCFKAISLFQSLRGVINMKDAKLKEFHMALASVTGQGIVLNGNVYSNVRMIKSQWFEAAEKNGEWVIPVLYMPDVPDYLLLYDLDGVEVASAVEERKEWDNEVVDAYHDAINALKSRIIKKKQ